jgi:hypothetical protein
MIKNVLTRRKESATYLATVSRHRWSPQIVMKVDKVCSLQLKRLMKAAMFVESYTLYPLSSRSADSSDVY